MAFIAPFSIAVITVTSNLYTHYDDKKSTEQHFQTSQRMLAYQFEIAQKNEDRHFERIQRNDKRKLEVQYLTDQINKKTELQRNLISSLTNLRSMYELSNFYCKGGISHKEAKNLEEKRFNYFSTFLGYGNQTTTVFGESILQKIRDISKLVNNRLICTPSPPLELLHTKQVEMDREIVNDIENDKTKRKEIMTSYEIGNK